jgi:outer membrane biosynthesis protein TonB
MREYAAALAASLLINAGALVSIERSTGSEQAFSKKLLSPRPVSMDSGTQFEFVEAPRQRSAPRPPMETHRFADRDSVAQDLAPDKNAAPDASPKIEHQSQGDQLAQLRPAPVQQASAASQLSIPQPPAQAAGKQVQEKTAPEEPAAKPSAPAEEEGDEEKKPAEELTSVLPPESVPWKPGESGESAATLQPKPASAPAPPAPAVKERSGLDRIDAPAVSRSRSNGAQIYGTTSFEASGSDMGMYIRNMKEKIWLAWFPYLAFHYPRDFKAADAMIEFRLNAQGELKMVRVAEMGGSPLFAAFCMEAIQRAAPFGPLPAEAIGLMGKDELEAKFGFHYW